MLQICAVLALQAGVLAFAVWGMRKASTRDPVRLQPHNIDGIHATIGTNGMVTVTSILGYALLHRSASVLISLSFIMIGFTLIMVAASFTRPDAIWFEESPADG